jgi:hypothetical protein
MTYDQRPDMDDLPHMEWECSECNALNSCLDGDCQFCDGPAACEHDWHPDPKCDLVDICDKCGEGRA